MGRKPQTVTPLADGVEQVEEVLTERQKRNREKKALEDAQIKKTLRMAQVLADLCLFVKDGTKTFVYLPVCVKGEEYTPDHVTNIPVGDITESLAEATVNFYETRELERARNRQALLNLMRESKDLSPAAREILEKELGQGDLFSEPESNNNEPETKEPGEE